jgi:hypothetical protein
MQAQVAGGQSKNSYGGQSGKLEQAGEKLKVSKTGKREMDEDDESSTIHTVWW